MVQVIQPGMQVIQSGIQVIQPGMHRSFMLFFPAAVLLDLECPTHAKVTKHLLSKQFLFRTEATRIVHYTVWLLCEFRCLPRCIRDAWSRCTPSWLQAPAARGRRRVGNTVQAPHLLRCACDTPEWLTLPCSEGIPWRGRA